MMYRVILVDDEPWALAGLAEIIPWDDLGFEIAGLCSNAAEALDIFERLGADAVFTDIRMPKMNGMDLIARIKELKNEAECVVVSAYSDFEIARRALKYQAAAYITKPLERDEVWETAVRVKNRLDAAAGDDADTVLIKPDDPASFETAVRRLERIVRLPWRRVVLSDTPFTGVPDTAKIHLQGVSLYAALTAFREKDRRDLQGNAAYSRPHEGLEQLPLMLDEASASGCGNFSYSDHPVVSAVQYYIAVNYGESLAVEDLASRFNVSGSYLGELFKKHSGLTVMNFANQVRMENAGRLLEYTALSVKEIADKTGFSDSSYFDRSFRRRFGMSPLAFRSAYSGGVHFRPNFYLNKSNK
ncbi:MAG: response regulator [Treponema sp.]|jgi:two-component system response regulator YesN|nr:response regulator [Treponema sp.]